MSKEVKEIEDPESLQNLLKRFLSLMNTINKEKVLKY